MHKGRSKEFLDGTRRHGAYRFSFEGFFRSRLGQPWSKIHSEMSKEFDRRTYAGYQFWKMVEWEVAQNVWIGAATGTVYEPAARYGDLAVNGFYVHPWTGVLCFQKCPPRSKEKPKEATRIIIDDRRALQKIEGIWYYTEYTKESYGAYASYLRPSTDWNITKKRQLNSKELAINKLVNNPEEWEMHICNVCNLVSTLGYKREQKCIWDETSNWWVCWTCHGDVWRQTEAKIRRPPLAQTARAFA
jgi:hypothetical protein